MTEPPPRKRFQIHLSTAIVMMFVAGWILWTNLTPRRQYYVSSYTSRFPEMDLGITVDVELGDKEVWYIERRTAGSRLWPKPNFRGGPSGVNDLRIRNSLSDDEREALSGFPSSEVEQAAWNKPLTFSGRVIWTNLISHLANLIFETGITAFLCEWLIRRRAARKGA